MQEPNELTQLLVKMTELLQLDNPSRSYAQCGQAISDQGEVWADVENIVSDLETHAPTRAMKDAFDQRAGDFDSYVRALPYPDRARGIMAAIWL